MLDVDKHIDWVAHWHKEVVELVKPLFVIDDFLEEHREEGATPVQEATPGRLPHVPLPVGYNIDLPSVELKLTLFRLS